MSIDTIRLGADVEICSWGWVDRELTSVDSVTGSRQVKLISTGRNSEGNTVPRLTFMYESSVSGGCPTAGHLLAEVSLPKFIHGSNCDLLGDAEVQGGVMAMVGWVEDRIGATSEGTWLISRLDAVYSWDVGKDIAYYFDALGTAPVSGYTRCPYIQDDGITQGLTWRCKSRRVNAYDKGLEAHLDLDGRLRLEIQALNRDSVKTIMERQGVAGHAPDITGELGRAEVRSWLSRVGMTETILAKADVLTTLISEFGYEGAKARFFFLEGYKQLGTGLKEHMSKSGYAHNHSEAVKRGWFCASEKELPGLTV